MIPFQPFPSLYPILEIFWVLMYTLVCYLWYWLFSYGNRSINGDDLYLVMNLFHMFIIAWVWNALHFSQVQAFMVSLWFLCRISHISLFAWFLTYLVISTNEGNSLPQYSHLKSRSLGYCIFSNLQFPFGKYSSWERIGANHLEIRRCTVPGRE